MNTSEELLKKIESNQATVGIIGLGYVGYNGLAYSDQK